MLIASVIISLAFVLIRQGQESLSWPQTDGAVRSTTVEHHVSRTQSTKNSPSTRSETYCLHIEYDYSVDEEDYIGRRFVVGTQCGFRGDQEEVEREQRSWPPGKAVTVSYDPEQPELSTLHPGHDPEVFVYTPYIPGSIMMGVGVLLLFMGFTKEERRPSPRRLWLITLVVIIVTAAASITHVMIWA